MIKATVAGGLLLTGLGLTGGYLLNGQELWSLLALGIGTLWAVGFWRGWDGLYTPAFVACVGLAALGIYHGISPLWLLLVSLTALLSWDLGHFAFYLDQVTEIEDEADLQRRHLRRLSLVLLLGLLLGSAAMLLQLNLSFGLVALLTLLLALSLSLVIRMTRPG